MHHDYPIMAVTVFCMITMPMNPMHHAHRVGTMTTCQAADTSHARPKNKLIQIERKKNIFTKKKLIMKFCNRNGYKGRFDLLFFQAEPQAPRPLISFKTMNKSLITLFTGAGLSLMMALPVEARPWSNGSTITRIEEVRNNPEICPSLPSGRMVPVEVAVSRHRVINSTVTVKTISQAHCY